MRTNSKSKLLKKGLKKLVLAMMLISIMLGIKVIKVNAESMADMATSISTFEVLKNVEFGEMRTNFYSIDILEKGILTLTTIRKGNSDLVSINVYNESGETVFTNANPGDYVSKDIQYITLEKRTHIISIYGEHGKSYDLTTSFNKLSVPEIIMTVDLKINKTLQLGATLTQGTEKVTWKSSKNSVAKVSSSGLVTAKKVGPAIITATSESGLVTKIKVYVIK